eukprot:NODE_8847_length_392_cov_25.422741_g7961_i0.p1 GENE.NODE_8847_length_392_cov_25.422741_g7961_i0~~NODE_8847_length_392_cov_25.422741_g7961_i0.p1  ORF type:complete len:125 (-),score=46.93 NODE_8847_length_392_cov_25.422741_g7961_i0:16-369(-)
MGGKNWTTTPLDNTLGTLGLPTLNSISTEPMLVRQSVILQAEAERHDYLEARLNKQNRLQKELEKEARERSERSYRIRTVEQLQGMASELDTNLSGTSDNKEGRNDESTKSCNCPIL